MKTLYSDQGLFNQEGTSIFLGGPTPRKKEITSWRPQAVKLLESLGFSGTVLIPERQYWAVKFDYTDQVDWEEDSLSKATVILFWVPRDMETMPALTTNVEFGFWMAKDPEKVIYGRPDDAANIRYLDWLYKKCLFGNYWREVEPINDLGHLLSKSIDLVGLRELEKLMEKEL